MTTRWFQLANYAIAVGFSITFCIIVGPALVQDKDVLGGFAAGFVNPYASGYSTDVFFCWAALFVWVLYEARTFGVRHGWICLILGIVPGVAVGIAVYLLIRSRQLVQQSVLEKPGIEKDTAG